MSTRLSRELNKDHNTRVLKQGSLVELKGYPYSYTVYCAMPSLLADLWKFWQAVLYKYNTDGSLICRASLLSRWILFCSERPERFAHDRSSKKSTWAKSNRSNSLFGIKRGNNCKKHTKNTIFSNFSSKELIFFGYFLRLLFCHEQPEWIPQLLTVTSVTRAICSRSFFCHEWPKRITHSCSFVQSNLSDSLTGAL